VNKIYRIRNFTVKLPNPMYPSTAGLPCSVYVKPTTIIAEEENDELVPQIPFQFTTLSELENEKIFSKKGWQ